MIRSTTNVNEYPAPFQGDMVVAIQGGRKTQMRWVMEPQPNIVLAGTDGHGSWQTDEVREWQWWGREVDGYHRPHSEGYKCPYGVVGDRLWVQEKWGCDLVYGLRHDRTGIYAINYFVDDAEAKIHPSETGGWHYTCQRSPGWRPPIHMPRWASRITLEVTEVRVERVQEISEGDARAEGVDSGDIPADEDGPLRIGYMFGKDDGKSMLYTTPQKAFEIGWDCLNVKRGFGWDVNPWCWCVSFRMIDEK